MECPNCGGSNYVNAPLVESCPDCGIACLYDGGGPNAAYEDMMARHEAEERADRERQSTTESDP